MKKIALLFVFLLSLGCAGVAPIVDVNCPEPPKDLARDGRLILKNGVTLKCQVRNYSNRMSCIETRFSDGTTGLICNDGNKEGMLFFDKNDVLTEQKIVR
ncbi:MAG: hypothetical protein LBE62_13660 [Azonexus sp.]|jgi:hypothetical protein|nr:hypothetical protein [Azonexus sp.]